MMEINWKKFFKEPIKTIIISVLITFTIAYLFFNFLGPLPITITQTTVEKKATFDVTAEGKVTSIPDTAEIEIGFQTQKTNAQEAQEEAKEKINNLIRELQNLGIKERFIKTERYNLYPNYDYRAEKKIINYTLEVALKIRIKDFEKINQVVETAIRLGTNQIGQLNFIIDDEKLEELKSEARKIAIEKAKKKAREIAKIGNLKLGKIVNIQEEVKIPSPPVYQTRTISLEKFEDQEEIQIKPGEANITVLVTLNYETL